MKDSGQFLQTFRDVRLYCFSPGQWVPDCDPLEVIAAQIRGGADVIQLREKEMSKKGRLELGRRIKALTAREGILFIVNDDVDLALILDADGVHLGQEDIPIHHARPLMENKIIGVSTHSIEQVQAAVQAGADYIGVGPVFETDTKPDRGAVIGVELLEEIRKTCSVPYVAIGGIGKKNIPLLRAAGCRRAAVISDILLAPDIEEQCRILKRMLS